MLLAGAGWLGLVLCKRGPDLEVLRLLCIISPSGMLLPCAHRGWLDAPLGCLLQAAAACNMEASMLLASTAVHAGLATNLASSKQPCEPAQVKMEADADSQWASDQIPSEADPFAAIMAAKR